MDDCHHLIEEGVTAMATVTAPLRVVEPRPGHVRVTFDSPPINLFDPDVFAQLRLLVDEWERRADLRVVVFDSADPDYWISHLDVHRLDEVPDGPGAAKLADEWHHFVTRLARLPVITIAMIRGRARGIGNEFALACDMRFASREKALLAQPEVGFGVVPGGGGLDWLPALVGRSRAIEIVTSADDYDADTAERYGWINRAVPDDQLDATVDALANRIAAWDPQALADAKRVINERVPPPSEGDLLESFSVILAAVARPGAQARLRAMEELGWGSRSDVERDHPAHLVDVAERIAAEMDR
jgi:enoyl-CoA hydratase/carnithine racemase